MKIFFKIVTLMFLIIFTSCNSNYKEKSLEKNKDEIIKTEKEFAEMAQNEGIQKAFLFYAANDAVIMRNNALIMGKDSIRESFKVKQSDSITVSLKWKPDFVDVSLSGDLAYTYGKYIYSTTNNKGETHEIEGIFHTVWKKQKDGTWKFVWD